MREYRKQHFDCFALLFFLHATKKGSYSNVWTSATSPLLNLSYKFAFHPLTYTLHTCSRELTWWHTECAAHAFKWGGVTPCLLKKQLEWLMSSLHSWSVESCGEVHTSGYLPDTTTNLRMVLTFVTAHTFCASRDTRVSYGWCLRIQGYFCAV